MKDKLSLEIEKSKCLYHEQEKNALGEIIDEFHNGNINRYEYILKMYKKYRSFFDVQPILSKSGISSLKITPNEVIAQLEKRNLQFSIDASCRSAIFEILNFGSYESEELQAIGNLIEENDYVFDIGAHIGWHSINLAKQYNNVKFFSFEPIPKTFSFLLENIKINNINNITAFNFGFSDRAGKANFLYSEIGSAIASERNIFDTPSPKYIQCQLQTIDSFVREQNIPKLDFIKCDVEGAEFLVLKGGEYAISKFLPIVFLEIVENWCAKFGYSSEAIIRHMSSMGYKVFEARNAGLFEVKCIDNENIKNFNYLFLHQGKHSEKIKKLCAKITDRNA